MLGALRSKITIALPTMLAIQSFGMMCGSASAVVAVQASADLGVKATSIGVFTAVMYIFGMISGLAAGGLLSRLGGIRVCQFALIACTCALVLTGMIPAWPVALVSAAFIGFSLGTINPAGSRILARHSPPRWQPLIFSIKQTSTPMGGMLAGLLLPPLIALYDWRVAIMIIAVIPLLTALAAQPVRGGLDDDRDPTFRIKLSGLTDSLRMVIEIKPLFVLAIAGGLYTFVQMGILTFIVVYLQETHGMATEVAGGVFAIIHGTAIPGRIFWGMIAGRWVGSWVLLGLIGILMAASIVAISLFTAAWSFWLIALVATLLGISTNGVLGLWFSEFARLAPRDKVADVTGGGQAFLYLGIVTGPPVFGAIVEFGGGYSGAFHTIAALALATGCFLLLARGVGAAREDAL
jgi:sugar phosphate permease